MYIEPVGAVESVKAASDIVRTTPSHRPHVLTNVISVRSCFGGRCRYQ